MQLLGVSSSNQKGYVEFIRMYVCRNVWGYICLQHASLDNFEDGYLQNEGVFFNNKDLYEYAMSHK